MSPHLGGLEEALCPGELALLRGRYPSLSSGLICPLCPPPRRLSLRPLRGPCQKAWRPLHSPVPREGRGVSGTFTGCDGNPEQDALRRELPAPGSLAPSIPVPMSGSSAPRLQVILCFSPVGSVLRVRARKFPAVVNCTAINWFHEWPEDALVSVSARFLNETEGIQVSHSAGGLRAQCWGSPGEGRAGDGGSAGPHPLCLRGPGEG